MLSYGCGAAHFQQVGPVGNKRDLEVLVGAGQRVGAGRLKVRSERDDVATGAIGRERNLKHEAGPRDRGRIDRGCRAAGAGNAAAVAVRSPERQGNRATKENGAVSLVQRGGLGDCSPARERSRIVSISRSDLIRGNRIIRNLGRRHSIVRQLGRRNRQVSNRAGGHVIRGHGSYRRLTQQVQLGVGDRVVRAGESVAWRHRGHD